LIKLSAIGSKIWPSPKQGVINKSNWDRILTIVLIKDETILNTIAKLSILLLVLTSLDSPKESNVNLSDKSPKSLNKAGIAPGRPKGIALEAVEVATRLILIPLIVAKRALKATLVPIYVEVVTSKKLLNLFKNPTILFRLSKIFCSLVGSGQVPSVGSSPKVFLKEL
jgi:hypothetical protein